MNRLRVRVELNRRKPGVPMEELVSVVDETRKFFHLLAEDVQIDAGRGEWQASNFDPESLNFTAEYDGPASAEQIHAFGSAFGGATSLRRETIAQFTRIADFIGEDELVGFGLYQSDQESEPSDWRCLSRLDALRFADEIRLLAKAVGESESPLPTVMNGSVGGRRLFKDRREREALAIDPSRQIRDVESILTKRIGLLEGKIEEQAQKVHERDPEVVEERFLKLLGAMETFWSQAPRQLAAPVIVNRSRGGWGLGLAVAAVAVLVVAAAPEVERRWFKPVEPLQLRIAPPPAPTIFIAPPQTIEQISLEVPPELSSMIDSKVTVNVAVGIDGLGNVASAKVASTKGAEAYLLTEAALRAALGFRFRPSGAGKKTVLTFVFNP